MSILLNEYIAGNTTDRICTSQEFPTKDTSQLFDLFSHWFHFQSLKEKLHGLYLVWFFIIGHLAGPVQ